MAVNKKNEPVQNTETGEKKASLSDQVPGMDKFMNFLKKYQNLLLAAVAGIVVIIIAFFMLRGGKPSATKELNAEKALQAIKQYIQADSFNIVVTGNDSLGVMSVKKFLTNYKGTVAAKEVGLYGGMAYMGIGQPNEAIKLLKDAGPFGKQLTARKYSLLGDAYSDKGLAANPVNQSDCNEAIDYYRKAADAFSDDDVNASTYLFKAALLYSQTGKPDKAKEIYKEIKDKYPGSPQMQMVEKYLGKEGVEN